MECLHRFCPHREMLFCCNENLDFCLSLWSACSCVFSSQISLLCLLPAHPMTNFLTQVRRLQRMQHGFSTLRPYTVSCVRLNILLGEPVDDLEVTGLVATVRSYYYYYLSVEQYKEVAKRTMFLNQRLIPCILLETDSLVLSC